MISKIYSPHFVHRLSRHHISEKNICDFYPYQFFFFFYFLLCLEVALFNCVPSFNELSQNPGIGLKWHNLSKISDLLKNFAGFHNFRKNLIDLCKNCNQCSDEVWPKSLARLLKVQSFPDFKADKRSMLNYLSFETNPRVLAQFL